MRLLLAIVGFVVLGALWMGPLPDLARTAFSAHMAMHMGVVAVASAFLALGVAGGRYDPARRWPAVFSPVPASFAELIVVWTWHAPALHHFARSSTTGLMLEQGTFLFAGLWLWTSAIGGVDRRGAGVADVRDRGRGFAAVNRGRRAAGVAGLLLTSMHMTLLGALLALTPRPLYPHLGGAAGWSPLEDQHVGGAIMLMVGGLAYLAGGLWLTAGLLRADVERPARAARSARPDRGDAATSDASLKAAEAGLPDGGTV